MELNPEEEPVYPTQFASRERIASSSDTGKISKDFWNKKEGCSTLKYGLADILKRRQ
jgi:hypothetical protein